MDEFKFPARVTADVQQLGDSDYVKVSDNRQYTGVRSTYRVTRLDNDEPWQVDVWGRTGWTVVVFIKTDEATTAEEAAWTAHNIIH